MVNNQYRFSQTIFILFYFLKLYCAYKNIACSFPEHQLRVVGLVHRRVRDRVERRLTVRGDGRIPFRPALQQLLPRDGHHASVHHSEEELLRHRRRRPQQAPRAGPLLLRQLRRQVFSPELRPELRRERLGHGGDLEHAVVLLRGDLRDEEGIDERVRFANWSWPVRLHIRHYCAEFGAFLVREHR